ncbi:MAG: radical SAM protein, partial [Candidatus Omnitrophica bacterium]|nr:radical SAM protein [Candidatus Omnitrophota bacterium]
LSSRAVQFELKDSGQDGHYLPGTYKWCSASVKLIEDENIIDGYVEDSKLLPLDKQIFYIFGDSQELHDRIAGKRDDFQEMTFKIKKILSENKRINIKIGVSKYNFYRLKEIVDFSASLLRQNVDLSGVSLCLFPAHKLYFSFVNYVEEIKARINTEEIKLVLFDETLFDLLGNIANQSNPYNERRLLRMLGVISEHAFIGPQTVVIDPHHRCNCNCLHCWVHMPGIKHTQEFLNRKLDFNLYKRMIDDFCQLRVDSIIFQGDGEPLLCDKLFEMIRYARNKDIAVSFFTNGLLLDERTAQEVVKLKITEIYCSLPAGTDKTYALVAHNKDPGAFKKINENLKNLGVLKNQAKELHPRLIMTHVIHTLNYREIMAMAENDVEIGANVIRFYLIRLDDNNRSLQLKPKEAQFIKESLLKVKDYLKNKNVEILDTADFQLNHYEENTGAWSKNVFLQEGCFIGWFFCLIPALGDISFCCHLRTVVYLAENSFKQVWDSREYEKYRFQAKYLKDNKTAAFINGAKLYDEHCEHCDTHQVLRDIREELKMYNLERFL